MAEQAAAFWSTAVDISGRRGVWVTSLYGGCRARPGTTVEPSVWLRGRLLAGRDCLVFSIVHRRIAPAHGGRYHLSMAAASSVAAPILAAFQLYNGGAYAGGPPRWRLVSGPLASPLARVLAAASCGPLSSKEPSRLVPVKGWLRSWSISWRSVSPWMWGAVGPLDMGVGAVAHRRPDQRAAAGWLAEAVVSWC